MFGKAELVSFKVESEVNWAKGSASSKTKVTASVFKGDADSIKQIK